MQYVISFVPGPLAGTTDPEEHGLPLPQTFATAEAVGGWVAAYIGDDFGEAHANGGPTEAEVWAAFGALYSGLARGGNFAVPWWGDRIEVKVQYKGLDELLGAWADAERAAARTDDDNFGGDHDIAEVVEELTMALPSFGDPEGKWNMRVVPDQDEPDADYVPSNASVSVPYYVNGKYVQWPCVLGVAIVWQE